MAFRFSLGLWSLQYSERLEQLDRRGFDRADRRGPARRSTVTLLGELGKLRSWRMDVRITMDLWPHGQHGPIY